MGSLRKNKTSNITESEKGSRKIKESDLAEKVVKWLEFNGWKVYKEVSLYGSGGSIRIDILGVKDEIYWGLETKSSYNFQVMCQANKWKNHLHKVSIAVPDFHHQKKDHTDLRLAASICKDFLNIGLIEVNLKLGDVEQAIRSFTRYGKYFEQNSPEEFYYKQIIKISHDPEPVTPKDKLPVLYEEQLDSIAGNDKGQFFTEFKSTIKKINEFLEDKEEYDFGDMIKEIKHHYSNNSSAKNCLKNYVKEKFIPGFVLEIRKNKMWIVRIKK